MPHDCTPSSCSGKNYATLHGKKCEGYMDYNFKTDGWSYCNVYRTKKYLARNNCLEPRGGGGTSDDGEYYINDFRDYVLCFNIGFQYYDHLNNTLNQFLDDPVPCPKTHPFAFRKGSYCCAYSTDKSGNGISASSRSCKNDAYRRCPKSKCKNYKGTMPQPLIFKYMKLNIIV